MSDVQDGGFIEARVAELRERQAERKRRLLVAVAVVEGLVLAACIIAIFVLELIDPEVGIWVLVAFAALGGMAMTAALLSTVRRDQREVEELTRS